MQYDVAIIGGSYAGLAAAMPLARARRNVVIIDAGQRRNRFAEYSHGFLTRDGTKASEIAQIAKEQVLAYKTVQWEDGSVKRIERVNDGFAVCIDATRSVTARRLIIAAGITDQLPEISGLAERWGKTIFHCPYCHGYELNQGKIGIIASSEHSAHMAMMLPDWGKTTIFINDYPVPDELLVQLKARGVHIENRAIQEITGRSDVVLADGSVIQLDGIFATTKCTIAQDWIFKLGCEIEQNAMGEAIKTNTMKETSVAGIFACGDVARLGSSVPLAVGDGTMAGAAAHRSLIFG
ncbi:MULTISPECIES: NAD(P)/FAD-dependent oxidoreductase [unclassified Acinetobacter]|uniref:NAD(P)/FAD-dependent oxidoreductase n=1 Tax=unclassified Acinetobacter TaxID=196816 RepID=UPI00244AFFB9|nr:MULTISPECIES: NAD(P)/FAD-dependent oxidoreductase [unclassified Acinetobacter]MDH0030022.1 NAD(P)/FAD-dependent oxidoreductase [Acinetobacter sp. GD04021]MDH0885146.1 NAD(P)/FAD-dependent oxidoreductase [Acinetobacter sp. GD03873]MDH1082210.1 NAD(P)/FAD-dependent oxidoreductase [Acinetobacter sp. GD03983]MDH2188413.1 NAD(P)/FAD-dependent oxidoreductase [Acinetobacter sp. GD03645]MDH2202064.1 NAD(P)/FAD-dependent oxidoreductase [Acinetobacter sp. GD03647]